MAGIIFALISPVLILISTVCLIVFRKKTSRKAIYIISGMLLFWLLLSLFYLRILPGSKAYYEIQHNKKIFGVYFLNPDPTYSHGIVYDDFLGDCFYCDVYKIDQETMDEIISAIQNNDSIPVMSDIYNNDWKCVRWKKEKDILDKQIIDRCLGMPTFNNKKEMHDAVSKAINKPTTYFSCFYMAYNSASDNELRIQDIDLFIVDPEENIIIEITAAS